MSHKNQEILDATDVSYSQNSLAIKGKTNEIR